VSIIKGNAQVSEPTKTFRFFWDDDYFNDLGQGTDKAYTSGLQLAIFYNKNHPSRFFIDKWLPKAGDSCINTFGTGVMQIMYTPQYLKPAYYYPGDYSYAGGIVARHSLYSFNPKNKCDIQTEIIAGVMGPAAFAGSAQLMLHKILADTGIPGGWKNQYNNDILFNVNCAYEKQLYSNDKWIEFIGDANASIGTMFDAAETGVIIRMGKMEPYFNGFLKHYYVNRANGHKVQLYFTINPALQVVAYSAFLQGGLFSSLPTVNEFVHSGNTTAEIFFTQPAKSIENIVGNISYGPTIAYKSCSFSFIQTYSTRVLKGVYPYIYGNITFCYSW